MQKNSPPGEEAATTQKLDEILATLLERRDHLAILKHQVMGNEEEEEDVGNNNQPPPVDNVNVQNFGGYNNNIANVPDQTENKK
ncbi:hypothetical protein KI387_036578, partial [Taxus chinensis]